MRLLRVRIEGAELVLRIGLDDLRFVTEEDDNLHVYDPETGEFLGPRVTDPSVFAEEVARAMNDEAEDGSTPATRFLDSSILLAIEDGATGVEMPEEKTWP